MMGPKTPRTGEYPPAQSRVAKGSAAESWAEAYLVTQGYEILVRNARVGRREIDRIALHDGVLCFVEVRSRSSLRFGSAEASVDLRKQRRIILAARAWLATQKAPPHTSVRFDVITVDLRCEPPRLELYRGAFSADRR